MPVSLMADNVVRDPEGLCSARFRADIITSGVDYVTLSEGDTITANGETYQITCVGKRCHDECPIVQSGRICQLKNHCAFAVPVGETPPDAGKKSNA